MRLAIFIILGLLVLGGGGAGAGYYMLVRPALAAASEHGASPGEEGAAPGVSFVELSPLILPIIDNHGVQQVVSFVVILEAKDASGAAKVKELTPRLTDAYIQNLYGMLNRQALHSNGVIEVVGVKKRLNEITTKVMGEGVVNDVLLQVVQQRPI